MSNDYLSDEELLKLIADVEQSSMISAPGYLKSDILSKVEAIEKSSVTAKKKTKTIDFVTYRLKIAVAMAAAIGIFCVLPYKMPSQTDRIIKDREPKSTVVNSKYDRKESKEERKENYMQFLDEITNFNIEDIIGRIK